MSKQIIESLLQQREAVDREIRAQRKFYFRHNPPNTLLANAFNEILRVNGTFEPDWQKNQDREKASALDAARSDE